MNIQVIPSLELGDLKALHLGSEVVTVFLGHTGVLSVGQTAVVSLIGPQRIRISRPSISRPGSMNVVGAFAPSGRTLCHIYGPVAYLSANPAHIALAKEIEAAEQALKDAELAALQARLAKSRPIAEELATDEADIVANVLAERLDTTQLDTLAGWLKVG